MGADNTEPVFQIPVGLPSLERGRHAKKKDMNVNMVIVIGSKSESNNHYGIGL